MKFNLSTHAQSVMAARDIAEEWVYFVLKNPSSTIVISVHEVHYYASIIVHDDRCLKVVVNPTRLLVVTTYFDRKMKRKGC